MNRRNTGSYSVLEMIGTGSWICSKSSWLSLVFKLIDLVELVLSLAEFRIKLFEFSLGESRWKACSKRSVCSPRFGF